MKKIMFMFAAMSVLLTACEKEPQSHAPTVSFETKLPIMTEGIATLNLKVKNYKGAEPVAIPVTFSGTAVKGTDYTVSSEAFVYGGENPVTTITVTQKVFDTEKSLTASITLPEGFTAGAYPTNTISFSGKIAKCSFATVPYYLYTTVRIPVSMYTNSGSSYKLQHADQINVTVAPASTAVEGTHFKFKNNEKFAKIDAEQHTGYVELEVLAVNEANNKIVLQLDLGDKYSIGDTDKATITICEPLSTKLDGKWVIKEFTPASEFTAMWGITDDYMIGYPALNTEDSFTIDTNTGKFIPDFKSDFKNYFIGESNLVEGDIFTLRGFPDVDVQLYELDNTNRYFSAEEQSDDKISFIGVTINEAGTEMNLYLIDHTSKSWCAYWIDEGWVYNETKPVATMSSTYIVATFTKA